ncbi:hypothetical protein GGX14DRAFT_406783 [Mycena pura]|uniref:Uncharacterized protein n=1 Tax=Mycena pura TaxID=153505 RepID=A0AAD6XZF5_9AGAR|nr:hypothetical protein GGX14DRAFT_406783 [Mycena pura]
MKISNPTSVAADTQVEVIYTAEPGDPAAFFFEIVDNGVRRPESGGQTFSGSGSFFTIPGDEGLHFIEAYNSSAIVVFNEVHSSGTSQPFAVGPDYTVLPPSHTPAPPATHMSTTTSSPLMPAPQIPTPVAVDVVTGSGSKQSSTTQAAIPPTSLPISESSETILSHDSQSSDSSLTESEITLYESISGSIVQTVVVETVPAVSPISGSQPSSTPTVTAAADVPFSGKARSTQFRASVIGAAVGGAVALAVILFCIFRRYRHRRPGAAAHPGGATVEPRPFLGFAPGPRGEKGWSRGFVRLSDAQSSTGQSSSRTSAKTSSSSSTSESSTNLESPMVSSPLQMEWVLRPTTDPPPGYTSHW